MLEENHDISQWLPRSFAVEYPHRSNQKDITTNRGSITTTLGLYPVDTLLSKNIITPDQHESAMTLITVRKAIRNSLGVDRTFEMFSPNDGEHITNVTATALLTRSLHGMTKSQISMLDLITTLPKHKSRHPDKQMTLDEIRWISVCCANVKDILERLKINIDTYLETCANSSCEGGISVPLV